jgi:uncharacterized protein (DUF849 family)
MGGDDQSGDGSYYPVVMRKIAITCALTGAGDTVGRSPHVPVTPQQIAADAIAAAKAGAAIVHIHVRDPETGIGARDPALFRETVEIVRNSGTDVILNLTAGMGGMLHRPHVDPNEDGPRSDLVSSEERFRHVVELKPEICTIDCGSMNFGRDNVVVNRPRDLEWMARRAQELGVKPELECFDMGQVQHGIDLINGGLIDGRPMFQFVLGVAGGAPATTESMMTLRNMLPQGAYWAAFGISRHEFPMVAQAALLGGHVRVGLEDNLYIGRGEFATNANLVEKAVRILDELGFVVMRPDEARAELGLSTFH